MKAWEESQRAAVANQAFWPCRLKILQVFARRDPVVLGVDILDGTLRTGTPVCVVKTDTDNTTSPPTVTKTIVDLGTMYVNCLTGACSFAGKLIFFFLAL